jgi:hypothetical protein
MVVARSPMSGDLIPSPTTFVERAAVVVDIIFDIIPRTTTIPKKKTMGSKRIKRIPSP